MYWKQASWHIPGTSAAERLRQGDFKEFQFKMGNLARYYFTKKKGRQWNAPENKYTFRGKTSMSSNILLQAHLTTVL